MSPPPLSSPNVSSHSLLQIKFPTHLAGAGVQVFQRTRVVQNNVPQNFASREKRNENLNQRRKGYVLKTFRKYRSKRI